MRMWNGVFVFSTCDLYVRLQKLEDQMVGGEKAHDRELKEKRAKRKKVAEKRIKLLEGLFIISTLLFF